ncbi:MAG: hypothetical protein ACKPCM_14410, partial [Pseudanabaena sp.]
MNWLKRFSIIGTTAIAFLAISQAASARYVVFVEGNDSLTLQRVKTVSPNAFVTKINGQPAIQAGIFNSETSANKLLATLSSTGLSPQKYFSTSGGKESYVQVPFTDTTTYMSPLSSNPQQVIIQKTPAPQTINSQADPLSQIYTPSLQQPIAYTDQYQQITTNTVVPQVQTQQVLVSRWQQVLVPETRQVVTQTIVPKTQLFQTGNTQSSYVQPTSYVQPQTGFIQPTSYVQPQTGFVKTSTTMLAPSPSYDSYVTPSSNLSNVPNQTVADVSAEQQLPQQTVNPNYRYIAAVP